MRLIDADKLLEELNSFSMRITGSANAMALAVMYETKKSIAKMVDEQPTAYDVDKVVEQLEKLNRAEKSRAAEYDEAGRLDMMDIHDAKAETYRNSRRIVKSGSIE